MAWNLKKRTVEYIIYFLFWGVLLLSPFLGGILDGSDYTVEWREILTLWGYLLPAIIIFFVNNNLLMPLLLYGKKGRRSLLYMLCVVVACCLVYIFSPLEPHGKAVRPTNTDTYTIWGKDLVAVNLTARPAQGTTVLLLGLGKVFLLFIVNIILVCIHVCQSLRFMKYRISRPKGTTVNCCLQYRIPRTYRCSLWCL